MCRGRGAQGVGVGGWGAPQLPLGSVVVVVIIFREVFPGEGEIIHERNVSMATDDITTWRPRLDECVAAMGFLSLVSLITVNKKCGLVWLPSLLPHSVCVHLLSR